MNSSLSSSEFISHGCVVYEVMGGRPHQPSILTQAFLIIIIVVIILTSPVTAAMNSRVMIAVKMKARLRVHKSNITLALLASTDLTVGVLVQPLYVALMRTILLDGTSSASCALQVLTRVLCSIGVCASLIHMALISGEWFLAMRRPFAHLTLVTDSSLLAASVLAWLLSITLHIPLAVNESAFFTLRILSLVYASPLSSSAMLQFTGRSADTKTKLQLSKWPWKQDNNLKKIRRLSKRHLSSL